MADDTFDVVVIGTGVAGALAASKFSDMGRKVVMLEAGGTIPEFETRLSLRRKYAASFSKSQTSPYTGLVASQPNETDSPLIPPAGRDYYVEPNGNSGQLFLSTYQRTLGGAMMHWQGIAIRFVPNDFKLKSIYRTPGAIDWPLTYNDLERFYHEAEAEMGVAGNEEMDKLLNVPRPTGGYPMSAVPMSYQDQLFRRALSGEAYLGKTINVTATPQARNTEQHDGRPACEGYGTCVPLCPTRAKYKSLFHVEKAVKRGAQLRTKTIVTALELDNPNSKRVVRALYRQWDGKTGSVSGKVFVLAANAIETPKLLLLSNLQRTGGLANSSGLVGCNLMDHPLKLSYGLASQPVFPFRGPPSTAGIETFRDGNFRRSQAAFRVSIRNDGWSFANAAPRGRDPTNDDNNSRGTLLEWVARKSLFGRDLRETLINHMQRQILVYSAVEMLPDKSNRVTLSSERDRFGVFKPAINFEIGDYARRGLLAARELHKRILNKMGDQQPWLDVLPDPSLPDYGSGHIIGTTIMGDDPATSVVNSFGRAHDCPNLVIMGSSVFPSSAAANPTLTIAALVLRSIKVINDDISKM